MNQQDIIGFVHRGQSFMLRQEALQLDHVAQLQKGFAEAWLFDVANEAQCESGLHIGRQRLQGLNQRCGLG